MAYEKFLDDGEIVDANSLLIPEDFEKDDNSNVKKKFINKTDVPDIRTLMNDPEDDDTKDDSDDNEDDVKDGGGDGKFLLKKII